MTDPFLSPTSAALTACREHGDVDRVLDEVAFLVQTSADFSQLAANALRKANALLIADHDDPLSQALLAFVRALDVDARGRLLVLEAEKLLADRND